MLLTGTFSRSVDSKNRVAIPKRLRTSLLATAQKSGQEATDGASPEAPEVLGLYIAPGTDGSIAIYTPEAFARLGEKLSVGSPNREDRRAYSRLFYARAHYAELDSQGRVRIEPNLAAHAGLGTEVMLVGVGDHLELWDRERWERYEENLQTQYDALAERAFAPEDKG